MGKKKTHEEFVQEVFELVGNEYSVLGKYTGANDKLKMMHMKCDHVYPVTPSKFINNGRRCPKCAGRNKTHEEFVKEVIRIRGNVYEFLTEYKTWDTPIKIKHIECGHVWNPIPNNLIKKSEKGKLLCPKCNGGVKTLDTNNFKEAVKELVGDEYIVLGNYINAKTPIPIMHNTKECRHEFTPTPDAFMNSNTRCPKCSGNIRKTTDEFKQEVYDLEGENYKVVGQYVNGKTPIEVMHSECNHSFEVYPVEFLYQNQRCPICYSIPKGERKILEMLEYFEVKNKLQYKFDDCKNINSLKFDFAIFDDLNTLKYIIEYDGEQHFSPVDFAGKGHEWAENQFIEVQKRDQIKNSYCKNNSIPMFRIPYWKFNDIDIILNKLIHNEHVEVDEASFLVV